MKGGNNVGSCGAGAGDSQSCPLSRLQVYNGNICAPKNVTIRLLCDVTNAVRTSMVPGVDETLYSLLRSLKKGKIANVINWPVNRPDAARLVLPVNRPAGDITVQVTHWQLSIYKTTTRANTTCH